MYNTRSVFYSPCYVFTGSSAGTNCPRGTFNNRTGLTNSSECEACTPGYYCSQLGMSAVSGVCYAGKVYVLYTCAL